MVRAPFYDKNGVKKGAWSAEEDNKLKAYIERYGHWNWRELPKFAGLSRCGKSCRLRWMNYLRPNLKRGNFSEEEENIILKLRTELGNKWSVIAAKLPGRTDNEIKNHWHTHLKKRANQNPANSESKQQCTDHTCKSEDVQSKETKVECIEQDVLFHSILESTPLSPETPSSEVSITSDFTNSRMKRIEDVPLVIQDVFENVNGDFWTQPFVADNVYFQNNPELPFQEGGFAVPYVSYYDDGEDLLYQVMQEFRGN